MRILPSVIALALVGILRVQAKTDEKEKWPGDLEFPIEDSEWYKQQYGQTKGTSKEPGPTYPKNDSYNWFRTRLMKREISEEEERVAIEYGLSQLSNGEKMEDELRDKNLVLKPGTPSYIHQYLFKKSHPFTKAMSKQGYCFNEATNHLRESLDLSVEYVIFDLPSQGTVIRTNDICLEERIREVPTDCKAFMKYRSIDGTCNNLKHKTWGATFMPLRRLSPPFYNDGVSELRKAKDGGELPSARLVSSKVVLKRNVESASMSVLHMTYGQFLDHDLDFSPLNSGANGSTIACCPDIMGDNPELVHPECEPITIPGDDPFYSDFGASCMEFVRSVPSSSCNYGPRDQINEKTSYMDGSLIYGFEKPLSDSLREFKDGLLIFQLTKDGEELLPPNTDLTNDCNKQEQADMGQFCFKSGDRRVNEQPLLTLLHVVWSKHHNRMAKMLKDLNPKWDDEKLFQETRRIVGAQLQHIAYNEYVSAIFGKKLSKKLNLLPLQGKKRTSFYSKSVSAAISNEFAAAAFRFGHSQIASTIERMERSGDVSCTDLSSQLMNPFVVYTKDAVSELVRGEVAQNAAEVDPFFTPQVAGKLFRGDKPFGMDLVAINIQRGRDHGLPPYVRVRMACNLPLVESFKDLKKDMDKKVLKSLEKVYGHVEDIDLYIGGLAEDPLPGSLVGPTFACILADQFTRLKIGDRYYYETDDRNTKFTTKQLKEIRKTTLASIMCDVIPELKEIQPEPMRLVSKKNPLLPCSSFPKMNLKPWKE